MPQKSPITPAEPIKEFLSDRDLAIRYGVNRGTIWRWSQAGHLPKPIQLAENCTRWSRTSIDALEAAKAKAAA